MPSQETKNLGHIDVFVDDVFRKVAQHENHIIRLREQMGHGILILNELRADMKVVMADVTRRQERDLLHDAWIKKAPLVLGLMSALISGMTWLLSHAK